MNKLQNAFLKLGRLISFLMVVLKGFKRNQGILLSGAVAYYTLLSIVPMLILILIALSNFIEEEQLFFTISTYVDMVVPGYTMALTEHARVFLKHRKVIGIIGLCVMLFFSSVAFTVLENAMSVIFFRRIRIRRRHFIISAIIPYMYIVLLAMGIFIVSSIAGALETLEGMELIIFGIVLSFKGTPVIVLYILGVLGEILMLTSLYLVMPVGRIPFYHALTGGITATLLWEITRHVLVWYYASISLVNVIYGSFATAVVFLLSIEAAVVILLLGAQVIAELERRNHELANEKILDFET